MTSDRGAECNAGLDQLLGDWADAAGAVFHHGETLRGVCRNDLLQLMLAVQAAERERCARILDAMGITGPLNTERVLLEAAVMLRAARGSE